MNVFDVLKFIHVVSLALSNYVIIPAPVNCYIAM